MKKKILLLTSILLGSLVGCSSNQTNTSTSNPSSGNSNNTSSASSQNFESNNTSSENNSTFSSVNSTSDSSVDSSSEEIFYATKEGVKEAIDKIVLASGKVYKTESEIVQGNYYMTNLDEYPMSIVAKNNSTTIRYSGKSEGGAIVETKGETSFYDDEKGEYSDLSKYTTQILHDDFSYYKITDYESNDEPDSKESITYDPLSEENVLDISFGKTESVYLNTLSSYIGKSDTLVEMKGLETYVEDGEWNLSYRLTIYSEGTNVPVQIVTYNDVIQMSEGLITEVTQSMENDLMAAGKRANWIIANQTIKFYQGEFPTFTGTRFDPLNY